MTYTFIKNQPFYPPGSACAIRREENNEVQPRLRYVPPNRVMKPTEIPINYLSESLRFVINDGGNSTNSNTSIHSGHHNSKTSIHSFHADDLREGGGSAQEHVDNYKTEIWLDCASHAANAQYEKSKLEMEKSEAEKLRYRRQEQLKAGELNYYPGRDDWLKEWSRARTYGLPSPLIHNQYGDFIQGVINTDWLAQDKVEQMKLGVRTRVRSQRKSSMTL